jgi:hypothetical protein
MAKVAAHRANPAVEAETGKETIGSDGEKPNAALQALLDKEDDPTPWYEKAWNTTKTVANKGRNEVEAVTNNPTESLKGVGKGLVNTFTSDLWNVAVAIAKSQSGDGLLEDMFNAHAVSLAQAGDIVNANKYAQSAQKIAESGHVGALLKLSNDAQKGGSLLSALVPAGAGLNGMTAATGAMRGVQGAEEAGKVAADLGKIETATKTEKRALEAGQEIAQATGKKAGEDGAKVIGSAAPALTAPIGTVI